MTKIWTVTALMAVCSIAAVPAADDLKPFPPAEAGRVRYVLRLPEQADEAAFEVELLVGKTVEIDAENRYFFVGRIEAEAIQGWGYTRYVVREAGPMAGTLVAIDPHAPKVARFITLGGEPFFVRYDSRLPVVIYVPEGFEVRYRIWSAGAETRPIEAG